MDSYIKLIYLRSRWYDPASGRFNTKDSWQGDYNRPLSLNQWNYVQANPINYLDPTGHDGIPSWAQKYMDKLRIETQECYEKGDMRCVWWNYFQLSQGAPFFGLPHAGDHMERYLLKLGDVHYYGGRLVNNRYVSSSKWVFGNDLLRKLFRKETKELWGAIHRNVLAGITSDKVESKKSPTGYFSQDLDLYYALGSFTVWVEADYEVNGCSVTVRPTYHFYDEYDWHPGLPAGGNIPAMADFDDAWTASLKPTYAKEYEIFGSWFGPNKVYNFANAWFYDWPASKNTYVSWEYEDSISKSADIFNFDD